MTRDDDHAPKPLDALEAQLAAPRDPGLAQALASAYDSEEAFPNGARGARLLSRARQLGSPSLPLAALVVRRLARALEVAHWTGIRPEPVAIRGALDGGVLVRERLGAHEVVAHVAEAANARFIVTLDVLGASSSGRLRATLVREGRELASELLRGDRWLLPPLAVGHYRVAFVGNDGPVGNLDLSFEDAAA
ncbi:MAG: hypothetical protein H6745_27165 [Deltaproteobacteria bacterium]|nr:hypothetical protein [Deltaproteobacteria bacterium]